ncbi:hypothetical protein I5J36_gp54 [Mycobacterium phage Mendokysei]|uniref:Uncharacterized protein n=1 Tax=Mycobacterium phage Mendokysei TaxID=2099637 RepID=A0A2P1CGA6_9CAUD|nr:hypothetical protein I5J36_gp54 [Mycobacterium phage Mendokysei]AVJ50270.1 hypothetical protein SEA_MENDOKYSEI_54 [Mycobacterium phage Mendokysei]
MTGGLDDADPSLYPDEYWTPPSTEPTLILRMCCYTCGESIDDDRWFAQCAGCTAAAARQRSAELLREILADADLALTITNPFYRPDDDSTA